MSVTVSQEQIRVHGTPVATATVVEDGNDVTLRIEINDAHAPWRTRRELMDKAFMLPALQQPRRIRVAIPLGEPDLIHDLATHLDEIRARAAGVTCLIEGVVATEGRGHDNG